MIVLIAPENDLDNEITILNKLFEAGLNYYHFRKPHKNYEEHKAYLNQISERYHNRIIVHYFHELVNEFNLKGIHFQEQKRRDTHNIEQYLSNYKANSVSSSFHEPEELQQCEYLFDYHLLSPVFSSISKKGYEGKGFDVNHIDKKIVGMGGVKTDNLSEFTKLGFKGVGVLGGIWNSKTPIDDFKIMKQYFIDLQ